VSDTAYRHEIPVRYAEVDMQKVVFNGHYLAYVDDAMSGWMRSVDLDYGVDGFDFMVRHAEIDWRGSATYGDVLQIDCRVARWGTTSFDVAFDVKVREETVVEVVLTYVGVVPGTTTTMAAPEHFRTALSGSRSS
jgi:YbgC/YbaW family acyl-CoA thioester hydrolase